MIAAKGPNAAQIEFWNGEAANAWTENQARMDVLLEPLSNAALGALAIRAGERVLDVGCGCGATTLRLAAQGARAIGVDISAAMLERARARAIEARHDVEFRLADASLEKFDRRFDALFSRFGVMFFADPVAAFRNLHGALEPHGRIAFVCWQAARLNPWMSIPVAAAQAYVPEQPPVDPRAPGPFAFADASYLEGILGAAGFVRPAIVPFESPLTLGASVDEALNFTVRVGPLSRLMASVEPPVRQRAIEAVRGVLESHAKDGVVALGARVWIVTARTH
jgi:SAM-dependent methyltransferase